MRLLTCLLLLGLSLSSCASRIATNVPSGELTLTQALAQLDELTVPHNADTIQFEQLRMTMQQQLEHSYISKWTSAVPLDAANVVDDLYLTNVDATTALAHWTYRNVGDYDQNGETNIAELSKLGANLGKNSTASDWNIARVADGDHNGEVNISDITPIGSHLLNSVDAYVIEMTTTPADDGSWTIVGGAQLTEATPATEGPCKFTVSIPAEAGQSFRVVPMYILTRGVAGGRYLYNGMGGAPPMDPVLRQQVLDAIADKFDNLTATTSEGQDEEMAQFMAAQPSLTGVWHENGVISATFEDGRRVTVFKNYGHPADAVSSVRDLSAQRILKAAPRQASITLPQYNKVVLLNAFTTRESPRYSEKFPATRAAFEADGTYQVEEKPLTVDNFRALRDVGVLFAAGHGGIFHDASGRGHFIIATATVQSPNNDTLYKRDFEFGALEYATVTTNTGAEQRYAINDAFLTYMNFIGDIYDNHISFASDSLVFLPSCNGGHPDAADFRTALFNRNAAVVIGWDRPVYSGQSTDASGQFFDGVLGTTTAPGSLQSPPQRPFSYDEILGDMAARGISAAAPAPIVYPPAQMAHLVEFFNPSYNFVYGTGRLLPTISYLTVDEPHHQLLINGDFGDFNESVDDVLVSGVPMTIDSVVAPNNIFMHLDFSTGDQSMGYMEVKYSDYVSNKRKLSSWKGNVILEQTGPGSLHREVSCFVHFRADLDTWRNYPDLSVPALGGPFQDGNIYFRFAPDSNAFVTSSGNYFDSPYRTTWSDGPIRILPIFYLESGGPPTDYLDGAGHFDMTQDKVYLDVRAVGSTHEKVEDTSDGSVTSEGDVSFIQSIAANWPPGIEMQIDPDTWDIAAGSANPVVDGDITYTLHWEDISCETGGPLLPAYSR